MKEHKKPCMCNTCVTARGEMFKAGRQEILDELEREYRKAVNASFPPGERPWCLVCAKRLWNEVKNSLTRNDDYKKR